MRRYIFVWFLFCAVASAQIGFNFRATSGYVTDGAGQTYVVGDTYPTTRAGVTFGWTDISNLVPADRTTSNDVRLAGINYLPPGTTSDFKVDLTSLGGPGQYDIRIAMGDAVSGFVGQALVVKDNTTTLFTLSGGQSANEFIDATNLVRTAAAWPAGNVPVRVTMTTSTLIFRMGGSSYNTLSHIQLTRLSGPALAVVGTPATADDSTGATISSKSVAATSHTSGNLLVVAVRFSGTATVSATNTAGDTFVPQGTNTNNGNIVHLYAKNIAGNASDVVTVGFTSAVSYVGIVVYEISGADTSSPADVSANSGTGAGNTVTSGSFTTATADEIIIQSATFGALGVTATPGTGYTLAGQNAGLTMASQYKIVNSTQSAVTASMALNNTPDWASAVSSFNLASGVGGSGGARKRVVVTQ